MTDDRTERAVLRAVLRSSPVRPLAADRLREERHRFRKLVSPPGRTPAEGVHLDVASSTGPRAELADDGILDPAWLYWWSSLAAELWTDERFAGPQIAHLIERPLRGPQIHTKPAEVDAVVDLVNGDVLRMSGAPHALVWDVREPARSPVPCRGAVLMLTDALGAVLLTADEDDRNALREWFTVADAGGG